MPPLPASSGLKLTALVLRVLLMLDFGMLAFWPMMETPLPWWIGEIGFVLLGITLAVALSRIYRSSAAKHNKDKEV